MKASHRLAVFLLVQVTAIALAVFVGWNLGPYVDQMRIGYLENQVTSLEDGLSRCECSAVRDFHIALQSIQERNNATDAIKFLNHSIDKRIMEQTTWVDTFDSNQPENPVLAPKNEQWLSAISDIGEYRKSHPPDYGSLETKTVMEHIFTQAKLKKNQTSNRVSGDTARNLSILSTN
jgi:hypothetical protein